METKIVQCTICGAEIDLLTQQCPYCVPETAAADSAASALPAPPAGPGVVTTAPATPAAAKPVPPAPPSPPSAAQGPQTAAQPQPTPRPVAVAATPTSVPSPPPAAEAPPAPATSAPLRADPRAGGGATEQERALGLALFEAEEALARGAADKALVVASKAVEEHPESLTARALVDRARRELLRGRRRERLEGRVREAQQHVARGEFEAAGRIVSAALKFVPDHPLALELFGRLKDRRLQAGTAEAEAERELLGLARGQARQALEAARAALASGWGRKAVLALRRGLRLVPDDPDLLLLLRQAQGSLEALDRERSRRHALVSQVRAGLDLLSQGRLDESLKMLRAVLRENPDDERAQAAVQQVRRTFLRGRVAAPPAAPALSSPARDVPAPTVPSPRPLAAARPQPPREEHPSRTAPAPPRVAAPLRPPPAPARQARAVPPEVLLPRSQRRGTPWGLVLGAGVLLSALVLVLGRSGGPPERPRSASTPAGTAPSTAPRREPIRGPLATVEPDLRQAIEATLQAYAQALEKGDAALLVGARPDMGPEARERRLAAFEGALNATTDIRVLDVALRGDEASVSVLSTDVIVGGRHDPRPPSEEVLRFVRRGGTWALAGSRGNDADRPR